MTLEMRPGPGHAAVVLPDVTRRRLSVTVVADVLHARRVPSLEREAFAAAAASAAGRDGAILVRTCHRVELYVAPGTRGRPDLPELPAGALRLEDADAARHLIEVACGLDSAILGEDQILHQLRSTLHERRALGPLDPVLDRLFQAALRAGRQAHAWFDGPPRSLADVALDRIAGGSGALAGRTILVAGAGTMGRLAALAAHRRGARVVILNRTEERARALAAKVAGTVLPFGVDDALPPVDGVVVAVAAPWGIGPRDSERLARMRVLVVDLSSPPAVSAAFRASLGDRFVSVDDLAVWPESPTQDRLRRRIEGLVAEAGRAYCTWLRTREAAPVIQAVATSAEQIRRDELNWLLHRLPELDAEQQAAVEQMSHRLVAALLHAPLDALHSDEAGTLERAARDLFGL